MLIIIQQDKYIKTKIIISYSLLGIEYDVIYQILLLYCNFKEFFLLKLQKKLFWHITIVICDVLDKFFL